MNINVRKLADVIGVSGNNTSIWGGKFSISDVTMMFKNYFISLNAIATVEVKAQARVFLKLAVEVR